MPLFIRFSDQNVHLTAIYLPWYLSRTQIQNAILFHNTFSDPPIQHRFFEAAFIPLCIVSRNTVNWPWAVTLKLSVSLNISSIKVFSQLFDHKIEKLKQFFVEKAYIELLILEILSIQWIKLLCLDCTKQLPLMKWLYCLAILLMNYVLLSLF